MPNPDAQVALMRNVYCSVGLDPRDTDLIEAHGTGTAIGDPIEAAALAEVFGRAVESRNVIISSLKSNIGHLEGASGVCSVIKAALMLERKFVLPSCDLQTPNRKIPFEKYNMKVRRCPKSSGHQTPRLSEYYNQRIVDSLKGFTDYSRRSLISTYHGIVEVFDGYL